MNGISNKFESLKTLIEGKIDIFVVSETKIDSSFPSSQFSLDGFAEPLRRDRNIHGGGVLMYYRNNLPFKEVKPISFPADVEVIFAELTLRKAKWLIVGGYNPDKKKISYFLSHISKALDKLMGNYDNLLLIGDFNSVISEKDMVDFCELYGLVNLIRKPTCYKNPLNPSSIDLILTNKKCMFQNSIAIETGLSDHHKGIFTVIKTFIKKLQPNIINYRCYKNFSMEEFRRELITSLDNFRGGILKYDIFMTILNIHAPQKKKVVRGNNAPFMTKTLTKAIMHRSKFKNKFNNNPTTENNSLYKKQRNFCVNLLRKEKKKYYNNLDIKIFDDNKAFWKGIKPLFSNKQAIKQNNIVIVDKDGVTSDNLKVAEKLNNFFTDAVVNLDIIPFCPEPSLGNGINEVNKIIRKYMTPPSIIKIKQNVNIDVIFKFRDISPDEMKTYIHKLDPTKGSIENDIPAKILIGTNEVSADYLSYI